MVDFGQATYIDGTVIPGSELRRVTQRDTGDGSGVVRPGDLKITQMDVPGAGVKVAVGDALIQSRAPGAGRETYGVPLTTAQNYLGDAGTGLPGTGSSVPSGGRRDMVFLEILDVGLPTFYTPQVDWPAGQSAKLSVVQNVGASAQRVEDVPALANVTGYALAVITYPASTATVTNAMIEDLREVHSPREKTVLRAFGLTDAENGVQSITNTTAYPGGQAWPSATITEGFDLEIPLWAAEAVVIMTVAGARIPGSGEAVGRHWVRIGTPSDPDARSSQPTAWDVAETASDHRTAFVTGDTIYLPPALRGKTKRFYSRANRLVGTTAAAPKADFGTTVIMQVTFREVRE